MQPPDPTYRDGKTGRPEVQYVLVGASVRSAAESLRQPLSPGATRIIGVDLFGDQDTRAFVDEMHVVDGPSPASVAALKDLAERHPQAIWIIVGEWPGLMEALENVAANRIIPSPHTWNLARDHEVLTSAAATTSMKIPTTMSAESFSETTGTWLVKKRTLAGGMGVTWFDGNHERLAATDTLQRSIRGRTFGATFLCDSNHAVCLGVCRSSFRGIGELPFMYSGSRWVNVDRGIDVEGLTTVAREVAKRSGLLGLMNIDFIIDRDGVHWLLEVNPRWSQSSEIIERAWGDSISSLMRLHIELAMGGDIPSGVVGQTDVTDRRWYKRIVFAGKDIVFRRADVVLPDHAMIRDVPAEGMVIAKGHPVCTVLGTRRGNAQAPTTSAAL